LCSRSIEFKSTITLISGSKSVNAKSVLGLLSALIRYGDEIELICEGPDENEAMNALAKLINEGMEDDLQKS
jgi:phosphocarrier protein